MPEEETNNPPPYDPSSMSWEGTTNFGPQIAQWERSNWDAFFAQIATSATSSGDAGVLGNFPQEVEQEIELLKAIHAKEFKEMDARNIAKLAFETERTEEAQEEVLKQRQVIENLLKRIFPPPPSPN